LVWIRVCGRARHLDAGQRLRPGLVEAVACREHLKAKMH